ncbi:serine/threonine-protein kinase [Polyangium aurulentum]|uniref:serine/threonine-protein kinase n=1 Tax=Polyangium aurulentum TaxID=2567896 RepID=UPI0010AE352C|nr:serine/threonine-protein kinase [Polyangium aurulentum]UQA61383.1 protein kinase [Polyangium aurulentum]
MIDADTLRAGRYRVVSVLGRSTYAAVYEAHDTKLGDRVAVKVLSVAGSHREIAEAMFRKEVGALEGFRHPAVVRLIDHFAEPEAERLGIVLELVPGGRTLESLIAEVRAGRERRRPLRWRLEQLRGLLDGLEAAHRRNVIHRDVKPSNVLVDRDLDALKLADFGIARLLENYARGPVGVTLQGFYTRPFAAPEQVLRGEATFASDLHAFGLLAASLLAWNIPSPEFKSAQLSALLAPLRDEIQDPALLHELESTLADLLKDDPALRPRVPTIASVLSRLIERTTERVAVRVRFTASVRNKGRDSGCVSDSAMLADLNDGLRARYEPSRDRRTGEDSFVIRCYGKGLWALLKPADDAPEELVAVDLGRNQPALHARQRERAVLLPFSLTSGVGGSGAELINFLYEESEKERRREDERRRKESLLEVARFVLTRQRERMLRLRVQYSIADQDKRSDFGAKLAAAIQATSASDGEHDARGDYLKLQIVGVFPWEDDADTPDDLIDTWTTGLDTKSVFLLDGQPFATFHGYDVDSRMLSVRLKQRRKLPRQGELECKDLALEASVKRQESALDHLFEDTCVNPKLGHLLLYPEENGLAEVVPRKLIQSLEPPAEMLALVERALAAEDFFFIQGPPGTGKTTVITEIMAQLLTQHPEARILLTSQANEAVTNALDALRALAKRQGTGWRLLRDVRSERAGGESGMGFDASFQEWVEHTRDASGRAFASYAASAPAERVELVRKALAKWTERLDRVEDVRHDFAESVQVFGVTCLRVPTLYRRLRDVRFDWVIVDEAAKATPAEVLVSLVVGQRFILVGDHRQLPPFLDHQAEGDVAAAGLDPARARRSLFEELFDKVNPTNRETLRRQFRMHRSIGNFVGELFYADVGGLETGVPDHERTLDLGQFDRPHRVFWLDVAGRDIPDGTSWWNQQEIDAVARMLRQFEQELRGKGTKYTVAVIAPYTAQVERLRRSLVPSGRAWSALQLRVDTVDAFQGKQDDILVYSMVRVGEGEKRFLSDRRRLNVAFSRAKRLLLIVGHRASAEHSPRLAQALRLIPRDNILSEDDQR